MASGRPDPWPHDARGKPVRRVRVPGANNRNLFWRRDGRLEIGYRDSAGRQRWTGPFDTITAARAERDSILGRRGKGDRVEPSPRLKFGDAAERWLAEQVTELRPATQAIYRNAVENHLHPRWRGRRMDGIDVADVAKLVRELRAQGLGEWTIVGVLKVANRVFKFARRHCGWRGENPVDLLEKGERPRPTEVPQRRIYEGDELAQTLAAAREPWTTLFRLAAVVGGRESELLALWWENLDLSDPSTATITFSHQVDRRGNRVPLKTEESKATLPLPRATALTLLEHKARCMYTGPRSFVFASRSGHALSQRNVLRALYRAQERARDENGRPTFPELFEHTAHGEPVVADDGAFVPRRVPRRQLPPLPDFHALRHTAAMSCEDAEEARDLLRHRNSNVTRAIYRAHFEDRRREQLRARMEARMEAASGNREQIDERS
jgi:integrase